MRVHERHKALTANLNALRGNLSGTIIVLTMECYMLKYYSVTIIFYLIILFFPCPVISQENPVKTESQSVDADSLSIDDILSNIEKRYDTSGFTARFTQKSVIKAMDITDNAEGKVFIRRPKMMRWEYETPEKQIILTNGNGLWVLRPDDNQVMTGSADDYFGDGKGASFLSDIKLIRKKYTVSLEKNEEPEIYKLKLVPIEKKLDISMILLSVSRKTYDVVQIATYNSYKDETLINMSHLQFNQNIDDSIFNIKIPENADVVRLE